jgi:hypothetical protein
LKFFPFPRCPFTSGAPVLQNAYPMPILSFIRVSASNQPHLPNITTPLRHGTISILYALSHDSVTDLSTKISIKIYTYCLKTSIYYIFFSYYSPA